MAFKPSSIQMRSKADRQHRKERMQRRACIVLLLVLFAVNAICFTDALPIYA